MIRLVCIVEIEDADTIEDAERRLDAFRESILPAQEHGLTIHRATEAGADAAYYASEDEDDDAERKDNEGMARDFTTMDFDEIAAAQGWNADTIVLLLREYIANQHCDDALDDFAQQKAAEENA